MATPRQPIQQWPADAFQPVTPAESTHQWPVVPIQPVAPAEVTPQWPTVALSQPVTPVDPAPQQPPVQWPAAVSSQPVPAEPALRQWPDVAPSQPVEPAALRSATAAPQPAASTDSMPQWLVAAMARQAEPAPWPEASAVPSTPAESAPWPAAPAQPPATEPAMQPTMQWPPAAADQPPATEPAVPPTMQWPAPAPEQPMTPDQPKPAKKPVTKRVWFWVLCAVLVIIGIAIAATRGGGATSPNGGGSPAVTSPSGAEPTQTTASEPGGRDNSGAATVTLGAGTFTVGTDVQPGRYVITPGDGQVGNISITSDKDLMLVNDILGISDLLQMGVPSVTTDLTAGDEITISNMSDVVFTPAETKLSNTLSAGNWVVGLDIAPGRYVATPGEGQTGNLLISDSTGWPKTNEILGDNNFGGVPSVTVTLNEGDTIKIMGLPNVSFATA